MAFRLTIFFLCALTAIHAEFSPVLFRSGPHAGEEFEITRLEVETCIFGPAATTELTFEVRNPFDGAGEGEMTIELLPGDEIAGFDLEIDGEFRDSVATPRSLARTVAQNPENRKIDPGVVEWIGENRYRVGVFPIADTRRFRLRIDHRVQLEGGRQVFRLPIPKATASSVRFEVHGALGEVVASADGIPLELSRAGEVFVGEAEDARQEIVVAYESPAEVTLWTSAENGHVFCVLPRSDPPPRPIPDFPDKITIFWDCSRSSAERNQDLELQRLESDLADAEVSWILFDIAERARGDGLASLREAVETLRPDGATHFGAVDFEAVDSGAIVLVSDGLATIGDPNIGSPRVPVFSIAAADEIDRLFFRKLARETGGAFFDLVADVVDPCVDPLESGFLESRASSLPPELLRGYAGRFRARQQLLDLASPWQAGQRAIDEFCQTHQLASRWSSLLVLERVQDYVAAGIRPPDGPLAAQFDRQMRRKSSYDPSPLIAAHRSWRRADFPMAEHARWESAWDGELGLSKSDARFRKWRADSKRAQAEALARHTGSPARQTEILSQTQNRTGPPADFLRDADAVQAWFEEELSDPNQVLVRIPAEPAPPTRIDPDRATIRGVEFLQAWSGGAGIAAEFQAKAVKNWPEVYEQLLADHTDDFSFYLEAGELLWRAGHREIALRAVSNLAESGFGNATELRRAALRLASWGERDFSIELFRRIREISPTLAAEREYALQLPPNLSATILDQAAESDLPGTAELRFLMTRESGKRVEADADLRILLTWDDPDADFDLRVIDPQGEICYFNQPKTRLGGWLMGDEFGLDACLEEFQIRNALSGGYRVQVSLDSWRQRRARTAPASVYVEVIRNLGRENESRTSYRSTHRGESLLEFPLITIAAEN